MVDILGKPLMDATVTAENKLWWPMSEALYATMLAYERTKDRSLFIFTIKSFFILMIKIALIRLCINKNI